MPGRKIGLIHFDPWVLGISTGCSQRCLSRYPLAGVLQQLLQVNREKRLRNQFWDSRDIWDSLSEENKNGNKPLKKKILTAPILPHELVFVTYVPVLSIVSIQISIVATIYEIHTLVITQNAVLGLAVVASPGKLPRNADSWSLFQSPLN